MCMHRFHRFFMVSKRIGGSCLRFSWKLWKTCATCAGTGFRGFFGKKSCATCENTYEILEKLLKVQDNLWKHNVWAWEAKKSINFHYVSAISFDDKSICKSKHQQFQHTVFALWKWMESHWFGSFALIATVCGRNGWVWLQRFVIAPLHRT